MGLFKSKKDDAGHVKELNDTLSSDEGAGVSDNDYGESAEFSLPKDVYVDFYAIKDKKRLKKHILAVAEKQFTSLNDVTYQMLPHGDGYLYEIHQSGNGRGFLGDMLANNYPDPMIVTSDSIYRLTSDSSGNIVTYKLTGDDVDAVSNSPEDYDILTGVDKLSPIKSVGFGVFMFGLTIAVLGLITLGASSAYKYFVVDKEENIFFTNMNKYFPTDYVGDLKKQMYSLDLSTEFFKSATYDVKANPVWSVEKGKIEIQKDSAEGEIVDPDNAVGENLELDTAPIYQEEGEGLEDLEVEVQP